MTRQRIYAILRLINYYIIRRLVLYLKKLKTVKANNYNLKNGVVLHKQHFMYTDI